MCVCVWSAQENMQAMFRYLASRLAPGSPIEGTSTIPQLLYNRPHIRRMVRSHDGSVTLAFAWHPKLIDQALTPECQWWKDAEGMAEYQELKKLHATQQTAAVEQVEDYYKEENSTQMANLLKDMDGVALPTDPRGLYTPCYQHAFAATQRRLNGRHCPRRLPDSYVLRRGAQDGHMA